MNKNRITSNLPSGDEGSREGFTVEVFDEAGVLCARRWASSHGAIGDIVAPRVCAGRTEQIWLEELSDHTGYWVLIPARWGEPIDWFYAPACQELRARVERRRLCRLRRLHASDAFRVSRHDPLHGISGCRARSPESTESLELNAALLLLPAPLDDEWRGRIAKSIWRGCLSLTRSWSESMTLADP